MTPLNFDRMFTSAYDRLKRIGHRERAALDGETLRTTALVHELYVRLVRSERTSFEDSRQFLAYAAQAIRHMLVDAARRRGVRRGAGGGPDPNQATPDADQLPTTSCEDALALDLALGRLRQRDGRAAQVVDLHYFVGLPIEDVAAVLTISSRSVDRDWRYAKAFLRRSMSADH